MSFRVFYADGTVYDSEEEEGPPPPRGVQVILQPDPRVGVASLTGADYYVKTGDGWLGVDVFGLYDYLLDSGLVLFGRTITNSEYVRILRAAKEAKRLFLASERRPIEEG